MSPPRAPKGRPSPFVRALGAAVRARRIRLRQTCADLAKRSGLSEAELIRVEEGNPDLDFLSLVAIARALEIPLRTLLRRAERRVQRRGNGAAGTPGKTRGKKGTRRR